MWAGLLLWHDFRGSHWTILAGMVSPAVHVLAARRVGAAAGGAERADAPPESEARGKWAARNHDHTVASACVKVPNACRGLDDWPRSGAGVRQSRPELLTAQTATRPPCTIGKAAICHARRPFPRPKQSLQRRTYRAEGAVGGGADGTV